MLQRINTAPPPYDAPLAWEEIGGRLWPQIVHPMCTLDKHVTHPWDPWPALRVRYIAQTYRLVTTTYPAGPNASAVLPVEFVVTHADIERWGFPLAQVQRIATSNLADSCVGFPPKAIAPGVWLFQHQDGLGLDAARIMQHTRLRAYLPYTARSQQLLGCIPTQNHCFLARMSEEAIAALVEAALPLRLCDFGLTTNPFVLYPDGSIERYTAGALTHCTA